MPRAMIWDAPSSDEYPSVKAYVQRMKLALTTAHDALLTARVKQTVQANKWRCTCPFVVGNLVYISTKNISFPKGTSQKLVPKFVGPYKISQDFGNYSYRIELPSSLCQRGIHNVFHLSLLRIHVPNDDCLFPGRLDEQIPKLGGTAREWTIDKILLHQGSHSDAKFEVLWTSGNKTWLLYGEIAHLRVLTDYFEILGINDILHLTDSNIGDELDDESDVVARCVSICICHPNKNCPVHQDIQVQQPRRLNGRSTYYKKAPPSARHPHSYSLRQLPLIPLVGCPRWELRQTPSTRLGRNVGQNEAGLISRKLRPHHTSGLALNCNRCNRCSHGCQCSAPTQGRHYQNTPYQCDCLRPAAFGPKNQSPKSTARSTGIKEGCMKYHRRGQAARVSCPACTYPRPATTRPTHPFSCFVMQLEDSTDKPPEFVHRDDENYNIRVIHSNGESYYESIHFEKMKEFFILEQVLR